MAIEQAKLFTQKLLALSDQFRISARATTEDYIGQLEAAASEIEQNPDDDDEVADAVEEIKEESHEYAKAMVELADNYLTDIQFAYKEVYPDEAAE